MMWYSHHSSAAFYGLLAGVTFAPCLVAAAGASEFNWAAVKPTAHLQYHPCYDGFCCARLQVPMDWLNHTDNRTVTVAILSLPAKVSPDDPTLGGTIITNLPGGAGDPPGTLFVQDYGHLLQMTADGKKHYEIPGFDPRGVSYTLAPRRRRPQNASFAFGGNDASAGVMCGDGDYANPYGQHRNHRSNDSDYWAEHVGKQEQLSPTFGPSWASMAAGCVGWRVQPNWRFNGPFTNLVRTPAFKKACPPRPSCSPRPVWTLSRRFTMRIVYPTITLAQGFWCSTRLDTVSSPTGGVSASMHTFGPTWTTALFRRMEQCAPTRVANPSPKTACVCLAPHPRPPEVMRALRYDKDFGASRFRNPLGIAFKNGRNRKSLLR